MESLVPLTEGQFGSSHRKQIPHLSFSNRLQTVDLKCFILCLSPQGHKGYPGPPGLPGEPVSIPPFHPSSLFTDTTTLSVHFSFTSCLDVPPLRPTSFFKSHLSLMRTRTSGQTVQRCSGALQDIGKRCQREGKIEGRETGRSQLGQRRRTRYHAAALGRVILSLPPPPPPSGPLWGGGGSSMRSFIHCNKWKAILSSPKELFSFGSLVSRAILSWDTRFYYC